MAGIVGSLLSAAGSIGGAIIGSNATEKAAKEAAAQQQRALDWEKAVYGNASSDFAPYIGTGQSALQSLAGLFGLPTGGATGAGAEHAFNQFTQTPAYSFPLQQGLLATNRALAAQGLTGSGAQVKGINQYAQGYASQNFNNYIAQLASLAGMGSAAAGSKGSIGVGTSGAIANTSNALGLTQAAGTIGSTNNLLTGIQNGIGALTSPTFNPATSSYTGSSPLSQLWAKISGAVGGSAPGTGTAP